MSRPTRLHADPERHADTLAAILHGALNGPPLSARELRTLLKAHPRDGAGLFGADELIAAYRTMAGTRGLPAFDPVLLERLRLKPVRSQSGVTVLTVFTKPFPCPGTCIFCPNDVRMPKSYLTDEPGAQRAEQFAFAPYRQTTARLQAFFNMGHPLDKIEVIVLGGTWSFYPEAYQRWFICRVFEALNDFDGSRGFDLIAEPQSTLPNADSALPAGMSYNQAVTARYSDNHQAANTDDVSEAASWGQLEAAQRRNEQTACRCVGLVVETRPDYATPAEVIRLRRLGCTKVQLGLQSLDDTVLTANARGHDVAAARRAIRLFRQAGFKIHAHWMPNLYKATLETDQADFRRLFDDPDFRPDELKIYPCALIDDTPLLAHFRAGRWQPYSDPELIALLADCLLITPEYCRLTRIIRDIPATAIVAGSTTSNLREVVERTLAARGQHSQDIRAREIGAGSVSRAALTLDEQRYVSSTGTEVFLQWLTAQRQIAGFLRLLLPAAPSFIAELGQAAIIREVHIYGQSLMLGQPGSGQAQHGGLGSQLLERAAAIARAEGYGRLAVISAVGTRPYYRARGFVDGTLYQFRDLSG